MIEKIKGKAKEVKEFAKKHEGMFVLCGTSLALGVLLHGASAIGYNKGYCDGWIKTIDTLTEAAKLAEK